MKLFNAFQLMLLFAAGPYIIQYCKDTPFYAHDVLTLILIVVYLFGFGVLVELVCEQLHGDK